MMAFEDSPKSLQSNYFENKTCFLQMRKNYSSIAKNYNTAENGFLAEIAFHFQQVKVF